MGKRLALIIGNSAYRDNTLSRLLTPDIDVGALAEILLDPEVGAFDDAKVLVNMTSATVRRAISDFFAQKNREDLLLVYFSGHGVLDDRGRLHLAVKDTDHNLLRGTSVSASFIADEMDNSRSKRQVIMLDCCHSGAFARGAKGSPGITVGTASAFEGTGFGRVVLTASDATQYAWEGDRIIGEAESSLFTHYVVQGLQTGEADINGDGQITIDELYDYVFAQVVQQTPKQTPGKWSFREQGEIIIARASSSEGTPIPVIQTQPHLDLELQQKLERMYTRGLSSYWLEEWEQAAHYFQSIMDVDPDYRDTGEKYAEVRRQLNLKISYEKALAALEAKNYRDAETALDALVKEAPDYKDASSKLRSVRIQAEVANLYTQAKQLHQAEQWQAVINVFERITQLNPDVADPDELLSTAKVKFESQQRLIEAQMLYQQGLLAMNDGNWLEARDIFVQIQEKQPGFEQTDRLLDRVQAEVAKKEAQDKIEEGDEILLEDAEQTIQGLKTDQIQEEPTQGRRYPKLAVIAVAAVAIIVIYGIVLFTSYCRPGAWYCENFEENTVEGWVLNEEWEVVPDGDNLVLSGIGQFRHDQATLEDGYEWNDYRVRFKVKLHEGQLRAIYRMTQDGDDRYYVSFNRAWLSLVRQGRFMRIGNIKLDSDTWHTIEISGKGGTIQVFLDDVEVLTYTDDDPILRGTIGFDVMYQARVFVDDIEVMPAER